MPLLTVVENYIAAALKRAEAQQLEDGRIAATIPDCFGVVALGVDVHECTLNLYARLEDWVRVSLTNGHEIPVIDGINLNTDAGRILATYHGGGPTPIGGEFFGSEQEMEAAFAKWDKEPSE